jgi:hypothetical protein
MATRGSTERSGYTMQYYHERDKRDLDRIYALLGLQATPALRMHDRDCCAKPVPRNPGKQNT